MRRLEHGGIFFRLLFLLFFVGLLFLLFVFRHQVMEFAGEAWILNDPPAQSDVIVVLGDDNYRGDRAFHGAELYRAGIAPIVVASGRMLRPEVGIADMIAHDLQSFGVPATSIVKFPHQAANTKQEAEALSRLVTSRGWKRVQVVTSNYHTRRARFIFESVMPPGVTIHVSGARDFQFDPSRWWDSRESEKLFFDELVGYVVARWELRSKAAAVAGALIWGQPAAGRRVELYAPEWVKR